ncbi:zona pellucida sperm-binding protein 3-like isoform X2 [Protopterus annectens]|uniref:zona pellucida sperm-binding protein 3-like isoform X2 n=1 Tax=Protopterus annectens TaxID=7888 RepID=UPI001CFBC92E|nr:zona pellucida sperm-binding protein 3-like isoform X2 [Protopterus annectens]
MVSLGLWMLAGCFFMFTSVVVGTLSDSVSYNCSDQQILLSVLMDPFGNGILLDPSAIHLGSCSYSILEWSAKTISFEYPLTACGIVEVVSNKLITYTTVLEYRQSMNLGFNSNPESMVIQCTYPKLHDWTPNFPSSGILEGTGSFEFSLNLMNEDFSAPATSKSLLLGSSVNIEAAVNGYNHQPMILFLDFCIAATDRDLQNTSENYTIIENHGCLVDGKESNSMYMSRTDPAVIQLYLQAFKFTDMDTEIYIHCQLLVWDPADLGDPAKKACSFNQATSSWYLLDNPLKSSLCNCCDGLCNPKGSLRRKQRSEEYNSGLVHDMVLGPLKIQRKVGSFEWDGI